MKRVKMQLKKETKGTYVYHNTDKGVPIDTLYIRKEGMPDGSTPEIILSIKMVSGE